MPKITLTQPNRDALALALTDDEAHDLCGYLADNVTVTAGDGTPRAKPGRKPKATATANGTAPAPEAQP